MENGREHEEQSTDDDQERDQDERPPEVSPFVPDLGIPNDLTVNHGPEGAEGGGAVPKSSSLGGAPAGGGEAPISFRRFLESSPGGSTPLRRPDVAAGLPDFVQDHLSVAAAATAGGGAGGGDGFPRRDTTAGADGAAATGTRRKAPSALSTAPPLPLAAAAPRGLPDFLSDGPMGSLHTGGDALGGAQAADGGEQRRTTARLRPAPAQRLTQLERENATLRRDVERLQQQLETERRRLEQHQQQERQSTAADARVQEELRSLRRENADLRRRARVSALPATAGAGTAPLAAGVGTAAVTSHQQVAGQITAAAESAEHLIHQLMCNVRGLRTIAVSLAPPGGDGEEEEAAVEEPAADAGAASPC